MFLHVHGEKVLHKITQGLPHPAAHHSPMPPRKVDCAGNIPMSTAVCSPGEVPSPSRTSCPLFHSSCLGGLQVSRFPTLGIASPLSEFKPEQQFPLRPLRVGMWLQREKIDLKANSAPTYHLHLMLQTLILPLFFLEVHSYPRPVQAKHQKGLKAPAIISEGDSLYSMSTNTQGGRGEVDGWAELGYPSGTSV